MEIRHPAQVADENYQSRKIASERLDALLLSFEILLRVDALLLAAVFLHTDDYRDDQVRRLLLSRKFQLGDWHSLLQALVGVVHQNPLPGLKEWFISKDTLSYNCWGHYLTLEKSFCLESESERRRRKIRALVYQLLETQPNLMLKELIAQVQSEQGIAVSLPEMCRIRQELVARQRPEPQVAGRSKGSDRID